MNFNWGTGIFIFSACFMTMILGFVFNSFQNPTDLVSDDYYQKEIVHQAQMDKVRNASEAKLSVTWKLVRSTGAGKVGELRLQFPKADATGKVLFFRPSNAKQDFEESIAPDSLGSQTVRNALLTSGLWRVKIDWQQDGKAYYQEGSFVAP